MKRTYIIALVSLLVSLLAWLPAHPATVRTATETFVTNKISQAVAVAAATATNYTDTVASNLRESVAVAASSATNYTDSVAASLGALAWVDSISWADVLGKPSWIGATKPTYSWSEILSKPSWIGATKPSYSWSEISSKPSWIGATKPTYSLNDVCPDTENWLGVPGTTAAGKSIKVLAKTVNGVIEGGLTVTGSSNNDNNTTKYRYGGVTATRNGTATDYLFDTSSQSGIARRAELTSATNSTFIAATNYTDKAIAEIPEPDYSTGNSALVATIAATAPPPGDYATVSNKAVNAVQSEWITQAEDGYRMGLGDGGLLIDRVDCDEVMFRAKYGPDRVVIGNNRKLGLDATGDLHGMWIGDDPLDVPRNTTLYENGMITRWDASGNLHEITIPTNQSQGTFALTSDIPGDYSTVSNKAVNAVQTSELSSLETDPTVPSWAKASSKPSYSASEVGAAPSSLTSAVSSLSNNVVTVSNLIAAVAHEWSATNTTAVISYHYGKEIIAIPSGGTLTANLSGWNDGVQAFVVLQPSGAYTVAQNIKYCGYGTWPTNTALCVAWAYGNNLFINPIITITE